MYFALCLASMLGYATQGTLMAVIYRRMDPQAATAVRGLCLALVMLPLLWVVPREAWSQSPAFLPGIALAGLLASLGVWSMAHAYRFLPIGITNALLSMFNATLVALLGMIVFREFLSWRQVVLIALILACVLLIGFSKSPVPISQVARPSRGILLCLVFSLFVSSALIILSSISRRLNPMLTAYLWESIIGVYACIIVLVRSAIYRRHLWRVLPRDILRILLYSSPTAIGTGAYMLAVTMGPVGIISAVNSTMIVVSTLLARVLFKERISPRQTILLAIACALVALLSLAQ